MTITLDISPEAEAELLRQAASQGVAVEAHAASLLEEAVHLPAMPSKFSRERLEITLREMAQFSEKIPMWPDEAFSRENLYQVHD